MTLDEFAQAHGLTVVTRERATTEDGCRFYARFERSHVSDPELRLLMTAWGEGATPGEAVRQYATVISGRRLVVDARTPDRRREFDVPELRV